jgi:hypothetical protein
MSRKFIISEDERARILGLHETAKINHGTVISEQSMGVAFGGEQNGLKIKKEENMEQAAAVGQPQAAPTQQSPIQTNLAVFDKYVPSQQEMNQVIAAIKGAQDTSELQTLMANQGWKKISAIMNKIESQLPFDAKSFPPSDENWLNWYKSKGIIDDSGKIYSQKVAEVFTPVVQKYNFENIKKGLGVMQEFAKANPQKANYRTAEFKKFYQDKGMDYNTMATAYAVGAAVGLIDRAGSLLGLAKVA